jgi:dTDP-4-dehydrorhamnose 3,5-epimerase
MTSSTPTTVPFTSASLVAEEQNTHLFPEVKRFELKRFEDSRGYFCELYQQSRYEAEGLQVDFKQDNLSLSTGVGTVRGLHFQLAPYAQGKLVSVLSGAILDVVVDLRTGSPHFGKAASYQLSAANKQQLFVPAGFAHGFCTLEPNTLVLYKVTAPFDAACDKGLLWNDPALNIVWPVSAEEAVLSEKDKVHPTLAALPVYFTYAAS